MWAIKLRPKSLTKSCPGFCVQCIHTLPFSHYRRHSHTTQTQKEMCVCVCECVLKRRAAAERVSLWSGFLGQTAACRLGKHKKQEVVQRCGLTSDRKAAPRPPAPAHPRQSQYLWTLKMGAPRIRLQERRRTCDAEHGGAFALKRAFFGALLRRAAPENRP